MLEESSIKKTKINNKKIFSYSKGKPYKKIYILIWIIIVFLWIGLFIFSYWVNVYIQWERTYLSNSPITTQIFLYLNFLFSSLLYCANVKDFIYGFTYNVYIRWKLKKESFLSEWNKDIDFSDKKVLILYTTCDDFDEGCLKKCINQTHNNCEYWILDDSNKEEFKNKVDEFVNKYKVNVIRRENRKGYKAGNLNHFLKDRNDYDFFVLLDADSTIPNEYVERTIKYFAKEEVGIVQCNNSPTNQKNLFDLYGSYIHDFQWNCEYNIRDRFGILNCCGHGAMIRKEAYILAGGFPEILLEDWGLTIISLKNRYTTIYANEIVCNEEFPNDYLVFKKRNYRWTQGGVECFKKIGWKIFSFNAAPVFRRLDIWISQTSFIITIFSLIITLVNISVIIPLGFTMEYYAWFTIITVFFIATPIINCFMFYVGKMNFFKLLFLLFFFYVLYASLFVSVIFCIFEGLFGKKLKFNVTPKNRNSSFTFWSAIKYNWVELVFATILIIAAIMILIFVPNINAFALVFIFLLTIPLYMTVPLTLLSNIKLKNKVKRNLKTYIKNTKNKKEINYV